MVRRELAIISTCNGNIYFKNIVGSEGIFFPKELFSNSTGYKDFSDPGNVIRDEKTGKYIVVDTEMKSFLPLMPRRDDLFAYAKKRFEILYSRDIQYVVEINVTQ